MAEVKGDVYKRIDKFHAHLDACSQCRNHPFGLCTVGATLLKEAATGPSGEHCFDCTWWELLEEDPEVGGHGSCHHPVGEAQHIAHTGEEAPGGLSVEGCRRACPLFEK